MADVTSRYQDVTITIEEIWPADACEWMNLNTHNRRPKRSALQKAIEDDEWQLNGATIVFSDTGVLLDGQNRLMSCIAAEKPIVSIVVRGIREEAQMTMDCGIKRSLADFIEMYGAPDANNLACVVSFMHRFEQNDRKLESVVYKSANCQTIRSQFSYFLNNEDHCAFLKEKARLITRKYRGVSNGPMSVVVHCLYESSPDDADAFIESLISDAPSKYQPIRMLQARLNSNASKRSSDERLSQKQICAQTVKAWNAFMRGDEISCLKFTEGGANPESFPIVYKEVD